MPKTQLKVGDHVIYMEDNFLYKKVGVVKKLENRARVWVKFEPSAQQSGGGFDGQWFCKCSDLEVIRNPEDPT